MVSGASRADTTDLSSRERSIAIGALVVAVIFLLGVGAVLDRVTTQSQPAVAVIPPAVPFPRTVVDDFPTRPGPGLGLASTGQRWTAVRGQWAIGNGTAELVGPAPLGADFALVRVGRGPGSVSVTAQTMTKGMGLAFRCKNLLDCWTLTAVPDVGTWNLTKIKSAVPVDMGNIGTVPVSSGTRVRVTTNADGFDVLVNDVLARHVDDKDLNDAPSAGLVAQQEANATVGRFASFKAEQLNILGPDAPVRDDFDRPPGGSLGTTTTHQKWDVASGEWGIRDNEAVLLSSPSDLASIATVDVGRSDGWVQVTGSVVPDGFGAVFRYRDPKNYWKVVAVPFYGTFNIFKVIDGREFKVDSTGLTTFDVSSTIGIRLRGADLTFFVDGFETKTVHSTDLQNAQGAGIVISSAKGKGARFAGFAAGPLDLAGTP
jgi:hypothetical protein